MSTQQRRQMFRWVRTHRHAHIRLSSFQRKPFESLSVLIGSLRNRTADVRICFCCWRKLLFNWIFCPDLLMWDSLFTPTNGQLNRKNIFFPPKMKTPDLFFFFFLSLSDRIFRSLCRLLLGVDTGLLDCSDMLLQSPVIL